MKLYLAHWATPDDLDAERDDSQFDCTADMAEPVGVVLVSRSKAAIHKLQEQARWEVVDMVGGRNDEEAKPYLRAEWRQHQPAGRFSQRFYQRWELVDLEAGDDAEPLVQLVLREATVLP